MQAFLRSPRPLRAFASPSGREQWQKTTRTGLIELSFFSDSETAPERNGIPLGARTKTQSTQV